MTRGFNIRFSRVYKAFVETPELAKFRRYLEVWSWILNNQVAIIEQKIERCNDAIADDHGVARDRSVFRITDYHRVYDAEEHPVLGPLMEEVRVLVRKYSKDLVLACGVANLPEPGDAFARHFARYQGLFNDGVYGPTGEDAELYQNVPSHSDLCSFKKFEEEDFGTNLILKHIESVYTRLRSTISWVLRKPVLVDSPLPEYIHLSTIRTAVHYFAGLYVSLLFTSTLGILNSLGSDTKRIIVLGFLSLVLMWSLILLIPSLKRNDLFAIAGAYFAVGGIYIGSKGHDSC